MASRRSSELARGAGLSFLLALGGCAGVRPQDKELLADPAMIYGAGGAASRQEQHVLDNRQGARTSGGAGGGCGCN